MNDIPPWLRQAAVSTVNAVISPEASCEPAFDAWDSVHNALMEKHRTGVDRSFFLMSAPLRVTSSREEVVATFNGGGKWYGGRLVRRRWIATLLRRHEDYVRGLEEGYELGRESARAAIRNNYQENVEEVLCEAPRPDGSSMVYFIEDTANGNIKIGRSVNPIRRLRALQAGSGSSLRLLAVTGEHTEAALHEAFKVDRVHGEWFRPSDTLRAFIAEVSRG